MPFDSVSMWEGIDEEFMIIESLKAIRIAYIPSGNAVPPAHAFADPNRKRMFQPGIYCIPTGRLSIIRGKKGAGY
jgi:hypothetical protein